MDGITGCLLGALLGDVIGAVVEGESKRYIAKTYRDLDHMLSRATVPEVLGRHWTVGRFTDDTQMSVCVAEWLLDSPVLDGADLMSRFCEAYRPGRRYGPSTAHILQAYAENKGDWRDYATYMFPAGSYGNGSAMRVAPVGCYFAHNPKRLLSTALLSSRTTHSHPLAMQAAVLQASAVAAALNWKGPVQRSDFLNVLHARLDELAQLYDVSSFRQALKQLADPETVLDCIGTGVEAIESVPIALHCFLAAPDDFEAALSMAIFAGGDTDTIASMAGALVGARVGLAGIPRRWLAQVKEEEITPGTLQRLARRLARSPLLEVSRRVFVGKSWVLFENGTTVVLDGATLSDEELRQQAYQVLQRGGRVVPGSPSGDFQVHSLRDTPGWLVTGDHPQIVNFVMPDDVSDPAPLSVGLLGRARRDQDAQAPCLFHLERAAD